MTNIFVGSLAQLEEHEIFKLVVPESKPGTSKWTSQEDMSDTKFGTSFPT